MAGNRTQALGKLYKKITNEDMPAGANTTTEALQKVYEALTNDTTHHINVTEIIDDLATNWSGGGGGGSSDFSTAQVTVVTNDSFRLPDAIMVMDDILRTEVWFESGDYPLLLYKGEYHEARIIPPDQMSITSATGSGGVSVSTNPPFGYFVTITGDGTLNVTVE